MVQEVVSRPGWSSGNSMVFVFDELLPIGSDRDAYAVEHNNNDNTKQARLHIVCAADCTTPPPPPPLPPDTCTNPDISVRVSLGADDAEEKSNGTVKRASSDLELVFDGSNQEVGMRFQNIQIPPDSTITCADIQFTVDEKNSIATSLTINGEDVDNAIKFSSSNNNISNRIKTTASVGWSPAPWTTIGAAGPDQSTPDIKSVVQEIIDRQGWSQGNALAVIITGTGERTAESYNGSHDKAPLLRVSFDLLPPPPPPPPPAPLVLNDLGDVTLSIPLAPNEVLTYIGGFWSNQPPLPGPQGDPGPSGLPCNGCVNSASLADNAVITAKIKDNAVTADKIPSNAITNSKLADGAVNSAELVDDAVITAKIKDNAVTADKIPSNAITNSKLADGAVNSAELVDML